jgi:hypothetical protein
MVMEFIVNTSALPKTDLKRIKDYVKAARNLMVQLPNMGPLPKPKTVKVVVGRVVGAASRASQGQEG